MKKHEFNKDFEMSENYFEQSRRELILKTGADFKVSSDYFENQREKLLLKLDQKQRFQLNIKRIGIAASFIFLFGIAFQYLNSANSTKSTASIEAYATLSELYVEPEPQLEIEDTDLIEAYFGDLDGVNVASEIKKPANSATANLIIDPKIEKTSEAEEHKEEEQVNEVLYDLFINEKSSSEEEDLEEEDYYL